MRRFFVTITITVICLIAALAAHAKEPLSLKGYMIGSKQIGCPGGTLSKEQTRTGETMCHLGPTTLANQPVNDYAVMVKDNKISGVMFLMKYKGRYYNSAVIDALKSKYGKPAIQKEHQYFYIWQQGSLVLSFDGLEGTAILADMSKARTNEEKAAIKNKEDI